MRTLSSGRSRASSSSPSTSASPPSPSTPSAHDTDRSDRTETPRARRSGCPPPVGDQLATEASSCSRAAGETGWSPARSRRDGEGARLRPAREGDRTLSVVPLLEPRFGLSARGLAGEGCQAGRSANARHRGERWPSSPASAAGERPPRGCAILAERRAAGRPCRSAHRLGRQRRSARAAWAARVAGVLNCRCRPGPGQAPPGACG